MLKVVEREAPEYIPEIESGDIAVGKAYKLIKRDEIKARVEEIHKKRITEPDGRYDVVVIDLTQHTAMPVDFSSKQRHI